VAEILQNDNSRGRQLTDAGDYNGTLLPLATGFFICGQFRFAVPLGWDAYSFVTSKS